MDIENNSKNQLDKNFVETIKLFNENNINYWICHGTLLGIIRDRKLISWDHDIDIAVWYKEGLHEKIKNLMRENLFELKEKYFSEDGLLTFTKGSGREIDINFYNIVKNIDNNKIASVKWYVPKNMKPGKIFVMDSITPHNSNSVSSIPRLAINVKIQPRSLHYVYKIFNLKKSFKNNLKFNFEKLEHDLQQCVVFSNFFIESIPS